jgi:Spy/CpxP family protein refolding chaperone
MTAVASGVEHQRAPRWMVTALVASLALNLAVVGAAVSSYWRNGWDPPGARAAGAFVPRHELGYAASLPPDRVKEIERLTQQERREVVPLRRALLDARAESIKALTAEPFDKQRYLDAHAKLEAADRKSREAAFKLHRAIGLVLTPEERRDFVPWRERQRPFFNPLDVPAKQQDGEPQR